MMKKTTSLLFSIIMAAAIAGLSLSSCKDKGVGTDTEVLLEQLDSASVCHAEAVRLREQQIPREINLKMARTDSAKYKAYGEIRMMYYTHNLDSAIHYGTLEYEMARRIGDRERITLGKLTLARLHVLHGNFRDAIPLINEASQDTLFENVAYKYMDVLALIDETTGYNPISWYEKMMSHVDHDKIRGIYTKVNYYRYSEMPEVADSILEEEKSTLQNNDYNKAIYHNVRGIVLQELGDTLGAIDCFAQSALYDLSTAVRDYRSLWQLAGLLFARGDTERAYRYLSLAIEDAEYSKVLSNRIAINAMIPDILETHEKAVRQNHRRVSLMVAGIALMALALLLALLYVISQRNKVQRISERERNLNAQLQNGNEELKRLNRELGESNKVKDAYLVQYLQLTSDFVHDIEQLKTGVSSAYRTKGVSGIEKYLAQIDDRKETKKFHSNFDSTFLALFPGFVEKVNELMKEECRLSLGRDGSMSTELRVLALIRLGITDSDSIAKFLRKSVTTIYNCRVKLRNGALFDRVEMTEKLQKIS